MFPKTQPSARISRAMTRSALFGLALLTSLPAVAQTQPQPPGIPATGADLRAIAAACAPIPVAFRATSDIARACMGYQAGVVTGFLVLAQTVGLPTTFCIPSTASDLEVEQAIVRWIGDSAERNAAPAAAAVVAALIETYPCQVTPQAPTFTPAPQ
jgi:hypothetical protein